MRSTIDSTGAITPLGRRMLAFPTHPRYARMLLAAHELGCVRPAALIAALTQGRNLLRRAEGKQMEEERTSAVAGPEGCAYPDGVDLQVSTDIFTCITTGLDAAKEAVPCQELADLIDAHEKVHRDACESRQRGRWWRYVVKGAEEQDIPPYILTPAGKAAEEVAAYAMEINALQKIIDKLEKKCIGWGTDQGPRESTGRCKGFACYFSPGFP